MKTRTDYEAMRQAALRHYALGIATVLQGGNPNALAFDQTPDRASVTVPDMQAMADRMNEALRAASGGIYDTACRMLQGVVP